MKSFTTEGRGGGCKGETDDDESRQWCVGIWIGEEEEEEGGVVKGDPLWAV